MGPGIRRHPAQQIGEFNGGTEQFRTGGTSGGAQVRHHVVDEISAHRAAAVPAPMAGRDFEQGIRGRTDACDVADIGAPRLVRLDHHARRRRGHGKRQRPDRVKVGASRPVRAEHLLSRERRQERDRVALPGTVRTGTDPVGPPEVFRGQLGLAEGACECLHNHRHRLGARQCAVEPVADRRGVVLKPHPVLRPHAIDELRQVRHAPPGPIDKQGQSEIGHGVASLLRHVRLLDGSVPIGRSVWDERGEPGVLRNQLLDRCVVVLDVAPTSR